MDMRELQADSVHSFPRLPVWIIEYVWAHKMMDVQEVVDPSSWPDVDSQPLSLDDSWRLRVASAQAYSIVKNREKRHYERVMGFLEETYRLLPRLVASIKHMKIMFGLKTMVIMWLLREGRALVDIVYKIIQFFPFKLPQYQDQCSKHEMFLMRKNQLEFKVLAQSLALDKQELEEYIKNQMEEQYGERYAQKVEERLLHYLRELDNVLPRDTYIDKILKQDCPVNEEEKLLLKVITSDSSTIATTLKRLLHCDAASCYSQKSENRAESETSKVSESHLYATSSKVLKPAEAKMFHALQPEVITEGDTQVLPKKSHLLLESTVSEVNRNLQTWDYEEVLEMVDVGSYVGELRGGNDKEHRVKKAANVHEEKGNVSEERREAEKEERSDKEIEEISPKSSESAQDVTSSPQFCSRHQRWVKNILRQCPDECSQELLLQSGVSSSPLLFQSSYSTSSEDLTPSDLPFSPDQQHLPSQTSSNPQTASDKANTEDKLSSSPDQSATDTSQTAAPPQPSSSTDTLLPPLWSPVVQLIDIASVSGLYPPLKSNPAIQNDLTMSSNNQVASMTSLNTESMFHQPPTVAPTNPTNRTSPAPVCQDPATSGRCTFSKLSRKFRLASKTTSHSQALHQRPSPFTQSSLAESLGKVQTTFQISSSPLHNPSIAPASSIHVAVTQSETLSAVCTAKQTESSDSMKPHPQTHDSPQSTALPTSTVIFPTSNPDPPPVRSESSRVCRAQPQLLLESQAYLLQSKLLQPHVILTRLSTKDYHKVTGGRSSSGQVQSVDGRSNDDDDEKRRKDEDDQDQYCCPSYCQFDVNSLYSSDSSGSDSEDSRDSDPDYKPCIKRTRHRLQYATW